MPRSSRQPTDQTTAERRRGGRGWSIAAAATLLVCLSGGLAVPLAADATAATPVGHITTVPAYWLVASDGGIFTFGGAPFYGSTGSIHLNKPIVGMAATPDRHGYWLVASDGGVFSFGDATFFGSTGSIHLNKPIVGMATTQDGRGYWLVASDGGVFSFGDAHFLGSMGSSHLNQPVVGMASTPDGGGYWMVAGDGGIFTFGDAAFYGSTGSLRLNRPIVSMTTAPGGKGYWFTASDGGVFAFGAAGFYGSLGSTPQSRPIVAMASTPDGKGYWFTNNNGAVSAYGDATYWGSAPQVLNQPVVGMAETSGTGNFSGSSYPAGSFGYDISNFQCGNYPPSPHTIGIVEVVGHSMGAVNHCLASEAAWAGGGLNLYAYLTFGTAANSADPACGTSVPPYQGEAQACNFGFNTAVDAFHKAAGAGVNTSVGWWLDVESDPSWSGDVGANAAMVQGAIDGLHSEGLNSVGIYASPGSWTGIVGTNYSPALPYWAADWGLDPAATCGNVKLKYQHLPAGPVQIVQYSSPSAIFNKGGLNTSYDNDYAC